MKIGKYYGETPNQPIYQIKETLDADYFDITNVQHAFEIEELNKDFLYRRDIAIQHVITVGGFDNLEENCKTIAAKYFCVGKTDRDKVLTETQQEDNWSIFTQESEYARGLRWIKAKDFASYRLSIVDSTDLATSTLTLNTKFVEYGIESLAVDGVSGLFDWVKGEGEYSGTGFTSKTYYTTELRDGIMDRLNGLI